MVSLTAQWLAAHRMTGVSLPLLLVGFVRYVSSLNETSRDMNGVEPDENNHSAREEVKPGQVIGYRDNGMWVTSCRVELSRSSVTFVKGDARVVLSPTVIASRQIDTYIG